MLLPALPALQPAQLVTNCDYSPCCRAIVWLRMATTSRSKDNMQCLHRYGNCLQSYLTYLQLRVGHQPLHNSNGVGQVTQHVVKVAYEVRHRRPEHQIIPIAVQQQRHVNPGLQTDTRRYGDTPGASQGLLWQRNWQTSRHRHERQGLCAILPCLP